MMTMSALVQAVTHMRGSIRCSGRVHVTTLASRQPECIRNAVGIYLLDEKLRQSTFGSRSRVTPRPEMVSLAMQHLRSHHLLGQPTTRPEPVDFDIPPLLGSSLDEHFQKIGRDMSQPYLGYAEELVSSAMPQRPSEWLMRAGWTRYSPDRPPEPVEYPLEGAIVFDTEVLYRVHDFAVMATAVSSKAWYAWVSPWLLGETEDPAHLIPLGRHEQMVVGHNVGYDRRLVKEEYSLHQPRKFFMDTMSLHIATHGMCSQQRPTFLRLHKAQGETSLQAAALQRLAKDEPWFNTASTNGLAAVAEFVLGTEYSMDKSIRDFFGELSRDEVAEPAMFAQLIEYCATDTETTKLVFERLLPTFRKLCPHPVSFGALKAVSSVFLPVDGSWPKYVEAAETQFQEIHQSVGTKLEALAVAAAKAVDDPDALERAKRDPWLSQLDWTVKPIRYTKPDKNGVSRLAKNQKLPGKPQWFKELFPHGGDMPPNLTVRSRVTPLLLRLEWDSHPLVWNDKHGWGFWTNEANISKYQGLSYSHVVTVDGQALFKLPHPDGDGGRCTNPLAKSYIPFFEKGVLTSENTDARRAIESNVQCSYWISTRSRVMKQMPLYSGKTISSKDSGLPEGWGIILPRIVPMGTVTRRAVEETWLTASNAKKNRIGSELKAMVRAPPGYKFVGADVDSEELWIASVIGDSLFGLHGGTALGWMTLEGSKGAGTDLHSKTASILGINRNEAKTFNYGRIYGAGQMFAVRLLRQFNPELSVQDAEKAAAALYSSTKGIKTGSDVFPVSKFWRGGTESIVFNQLELLAQQPRQRTPVLGCGITAALAVRNLKSSTFLTSRINWTIQSSGVDYLHLLIAGMHYLTEAYGIQARLLLTVHDEVRFIVKDKDAERAALALQIANLWTRAMFCEQLGLDNMPYSVAFFSLVDVDKVLRKEVDDPCVTPSNPVPLAPGKALDLPALARACSSLGPPDPEVRDRIAAQDYVERVPVMKSFSPSGDASLEDYVHAQIGSAKDAASIEAKLKSTSSPKQKVTLPRKRRSGVSGVF